MLLAPLAISGCVGGGGEGGGAYRDSIDAWHTERIERLRADTGWLTLAGLHRLEPGRHRLGSGAGVDIVLPESAPPLAGVLEVGETGLRFEPEPGVGVFEGPVGRDSGGAWVLESDGAGAPSVLAAGPVLFHVIDRGGVLFLRVRDREHPALAAFEGIERYPVDPRYRTTARLLPEGAGVLEVTNILGLVEPATTPGVLEFELLGRTLRLRPTENADGSLFIVFADATNGRGTYGAGRFLSAPAPDGEGLVELDFNRAYNPVCALSAHATCPLPPAENRLPVAIEAGEKAP